VKRLCRLVAIVLVCAACSSEPEVVPATTVEVTSTRAAAPPATSVDQSAERSLAPPPSVPADADFYEPPELPAAGEPGDVIWAEPISAPAGVAAWKVLYRSTSVNGTSIAVSGWVAIPDGDEAVPVVAFGHGTTGLADKCAPTRRGGQAPHNFQRALDNGWAVAYTDYQGLGAPGLHHYLVGAAEAHALIDVARSAARFDERVTDQVAFWGFSQGGHAALFAAELFGEIAPELDVVGSVAVAPAVDISGWVEEDPLGERHFLAMVALAYTDALGLDPASVLSSELLERYDQIADGCIFDATVAMSGVPSLYKTDPPDERLVSFFAANDPGTSFIATPILLATSEADGLLRADVAETFVARVCGTGTTLDRIVVEDAAHLETFGETADDVVAWLEDRFSGAPTQGTCES